MVLIIGKFHLEYILAIKLRIGMLTVQKSLQKLHKVSKISNFQVKEGSFGGSRDLNLHPNFLNQNSSEIRVAATKICHYFHWILGKRKNLGVLGPNTWASITFS